MPAYKPRPPKTNISHGFVCIQRSAKKPIVPPTTIAPTKVNGNSRASAGCDAKSGDFLGQDACEELWSCLLSEGILGEPRERLRIQPGGERDKHGNAEGHGLRTRHRRARRLARLLEPGVHDDAKVIIERGNDIQHSEDRQNRMA